VQRQHLIRLEIHVHVSQQSSKRLEGCDLHHALKFQGNHLQVTRWLFQKPDIFFEASVQELGNLSSMDRREIYAQLFLWLLLLAQQQHGIPLAHLNLDQVQPNLAARELRVNQFDPTVDRKAGRSIGDALEMNSCIALLCQRTFRTGKDLKRVLVETLPARPSEILILQS
jgi:hypothetical protein